MLVIEVGDVIRVGHEDYRVVRMVRDGRFVVRRLRSAAAQDQGEAERDLERSPGGREHVQPERPQITDEEKAALDAQLKAFWERFGR